MSIIYPLLVLLLALTSACNRYDCASAKEGYAEIASFAEKVRERYSWVLMSQGGRFSDPHLETIHAQFFCAGRVTLEQARCLLVVGVYDFLTDINDNKRLRPHLPTSPLSYNNIEFGLGFLDEGGIVPHPYISHVFLVRGKDVVYAVPNAKTGHFETVHTESFEQALDAFCATTHPLVDNEDENERAVTRRVRIPTSSEVQQFIVHEIKALRLSLDRERETHDQ